MKGAFHTARTLAVLFCLYLSASSAGAVDETFNVVPSRPLQLSSRLSLVQPDGKPIIIGESRYTVDGRDRGTVVRLNVDGTADPTFSYCECLLRNINSAALQADGKILLAGSDGSGQPAVVRLNAEGSTDTTYSNALVGLGMQSGQARVHLVQADGKAIISVDGSITFNSQLGFMLRLTSGGAIDNSFKRITYGNGFQIPFIRAIAMSTDGNIYTAYSVGTIVRYTGSGDIDTTWHQPSITSSDGSSITIHGLGVDSAGRLLIAGEFDHVDGINSLNLARIMPAGNLDPTFNAPSFPDYIVYIVKVLESGQLLIDCSSTLYRLNENGSVDGSFAFPSPTAAFEINLDASGKITFFGGDQNNISLFKLFRVNPNGDIDSTFQPDLGAPAQVTALARQPDGKIILAGNFTELNGINRVRLARIFADGSTDVSFDAANAFDAPPNSLVIQPDGKTLVVVDYLLYSGSSRSSLVRINPDGSLDAAFVPDVLHLKGVSLQADGSILLYGSFTSVNGIPRTGVARLQADGTIDASFSVTLSTGASVNSVLQLPNGKFLIGGTFTSVDGLSRSNLARLNPDGSLDQTFTVSGAGTVQRILAQPDGKLVVLTSGDLTRRRSDGSLDATFGTHTLSFNSSQIQLDAVLQSDGSIIVAGNFYSVDGISRNYLARFDTGGRQDKLFMQTGTDRPASSLVRGADGKVVVGGDFASINSSVKLGVAQIVPGQVPNTGLFDFDGDGRSDFAVLRLSTRFWFLLRSSDKAASGQQFYAAGDIAAPADYDGDGKTDYAVFRPSTSTWWYLSSSNGLGYANRWGVNGDVPEPADVDGDGKADFRVYRASSGNWFTLTQLGISNSVQFGTSSDKPVNGDFDGDGRVDPAVFRPSTGDWWYLGSIDGLHRAFHWGVSTDVPVPADFDGDGKTDFAVYRGGVWHVLNSGDQSVTMMQFGILSDKPVPADYDGDGKSDIAVFRPSNGTWYVWGSMSGFQALQFGTNEDLPVPTSFLPQ